MRLSVGKYGIGIEHTAHIPPCFLGDFTMFWSSDKFLLIQGISETCMWEHSCISIIHMFVIQIPTVRIIFNLSTTLNVLIKSNLKVNL